MFSAFVKRLNGDAAFRRRFAIGVSMVVLAVVAVTVLAVFLGRENKKYDEKAYFDSISGTVFYAAENDLLPQLGLSPCDADGFARIEGARKAYAVSDGDCLYTYYIGNIAGSSGELDAYRLRQKNAEEGRGSVMTAVNGRTLTVVKYYYRHEYLVSVKNDTEYIEALVSENFAPCESSIPGYSNAESFEKIKNTVSEDKIRSLVTKYDGYTEKLCENIKIAVQTAKA